MEKWTFLRRGQLARRLLAMVIASWLAMAGLYAPAGRVQAAGGILPITFSGDALPATVGTLWTGTYTASGGTAPYSCSLSTAIPGLSLTNNDDGSCTLAGTPLDYGIISTTIDFEDSDNPKNTGSSALDFTAKAPTQITLTLSSDYPGGAQYTAGYPVWVHIQVAFNPLISGKLPSGTVQISSGTVGPTCSVTLDAAAAGECALVFGTQGTKTIQANYPANGYIKASTASTTINLQAFQVAPTLSSGRNHTCYLAANGLMTCWGLSDSFPVDTGGLPMTLGTFSKISSGGYQTCGLALNGSISCWGDNTDVTQNIPMGQFVDISSGDEHVCAIDNHRQLHCWGNLTAALALVPTDPVLAVSAGVSYDCAIKKINNLPVCWGSNTSAPNSTMQKLAVGNTHACAIKLDGTLTCWGTPAMTVPTGNTYTAIDSGSNYSCAQKSDGKISCWGSGSTNLGMDVNTSYDRFSSGFAHTCALRPAATMTLSCWGDNAYGKAPVISISPTSLAQYLVKTKPFSQAFEPAGGFASYTLSVSGGSLPPGLTLSGSTLAGTPTTPGIYSFILAAAETFPGSGLPLQLTPGFQSYSTTVLDGTTTASLVIQATADAGAPVTATTTVTKIPTMPALTGSVLVYSTDGDTSCQADVNASGVAACTLYFSTSGAKTVLAEYQGSEYYLPSVSAGQSITVAAAVITPMLGAGNQFSCSIDGNGHLACWGKNDSFQSSDPAVGVFDQLDLGYAHACALKLNRTVACWGWNGFNIATPPAISGVEKITTANTHTCALTNAGTVTCWGEATSNRLVVPTPGTGNTYTDLDAGANHTCAIVSTGGVNCWGMNTNGQTSVPADLLTRGTVLKLSSGGNFSCALHSGGALECWGGIAAAPAGVFTDISSGQNFACGLKTDGSVTCWGSITTAPAGLFIKISAGYTHVCGLVSDEHMLCWGENTYGQAPVISITPESLPIIDADAPWQMQINAMGGRIAQYSYNLITGAFPDGLSLNSVTGALAGTPDQAGVYDFTLRAREADLSPAVAAEKSYSLTVRGWVDAQIDSAMPGSTMVGRPVQIAFSVNARAGNYMGTAPTGTVTVSAEGNICEVVLANGTGSCAMLFGEPGTKTITITYPGDGLYQPADNTAATFEFVVLPFSQDPQMRTGLYHTYIHKADGTVGCIGAGCTADPFNGIFTRLGVGDAYACGLHTNGEILCTNYGAAPALVFTNGPYIDLSVGENHVCALKINGQAQCLGDNTFGQAVPTAGVFASLSAGGQHTCALTAGGAVVCWGTISSPPAGAFTRLVSGAAHTCGLNVTGGVACWGDNTSGQSTVPVSPAVFTQIAAGGAQTCGLDIAGAVSCWGDNTFGQTNPIYGSFIALSTYADHVCTLRSGLKLTCWGKDDFGEAPQYTFTPLTITTLPALTYFEHIFDIYGGTKPLTAETQGNLPPGMDVDIPITGLTVSQEINDLSPSGMILYGTPNLPGIYPFVINWTDVSTYPLVMEQPYTLMITGVDLSVELMPFSTAEALTGMDYRFKALVTNKTALTVPEAVLTITLPEGLADVTTDFSGCTLSDLTLTCALGEVDPALPETIWITGKAMLRAGQTMEFGSSVQSTLANWPEIAVVDNVDSFTVRIAQKTVFYTETFDLAPFAEWTGGTPVTAPNGQTIWSGSGNDSITLNLYEIPMHKYILVRFNLYVIGGWAGINPTGDASEWMFGQVGAPILVDTSFCNDPSCEQSYPGELGYGVYPGRTGAEGLDELGYGDTVPDTRYTMLFKIPHTAEELHLVFSSLNLPTGALWGLDDVEILIDSGQTYLYLPSIHR